MRRNGVCLYLYIYFFERLSEITLLLQKCFSILLMKSTSEPLIERSIVYLEYFQMKATRENTMIYI